MPPSSAEPATEQSAEDAKLVVLARSSRARTGAAEGAAVRGVDGRTYAASTVSLAHLGVAALPLAVAMAVSSGADGLEAAAVVTDAPSLDDDALAAVRDLGGAGVPVQVADARGDVGRVVTT